MDYKLVDGLDSMELQEKVNNHLEDGWKPQGGVSVRNHGKVKRAVFFQALVREENQDDRELLN